MASWSSQIRTASTGRRGPGCSTVVCGLANIDRHSTRPGGTDSGE
ncbi:hypothetical protein [Streptomyces akebiae]|nr:hypothetical protein [Streptomyces akebiae]